MTAAEMTAERTRYTYFRSGQYAMWQHAGIRIALHWQVKTQHYVA